MSYTKDTHMQATYKFLNPFTDVAGKWTQISTWPVRTT